MKRNHNIFVLISSFNLFQMDNQPKKKTFWKMKHNHNILQQPPSHYFLLGDVPPISPRI